ncbi:MAG: fumarylacetoacetate hydrolase family protein [Planctomycetes bacterium]|nr:fumarylacetoacetate hydrolase family protein [Planctomycetota bacterium]
MRLVRFHHAGVDGVARLEQDHLLPLDLSGGQFASLSDILEEEEPHETADILSSGSESIPLSEAKLLAPIDRQEVWAAGVTYKRSKVARMEESAASADCYDRVYASPRPELFLKATPHRVAGPGEPVRIRRDSEWNVPEPELTLVLDSRTRLVGFTIGNDMSSRDIEGENPLYLPQAKVYDQSCALGPCITLHHTGEMPPFEKIGIAMVVRRDGQVMFKGKTNTSEMARTFEDLVNWLARDNSFPHGAFLLTGTGIIPPNVFTLLPGDVIDIAIDGIGTLTNPVA